MLGKVNVGWWWLIHVDSHWTSAESLNCSERFRLSQGCSYFLRCMASARFLQDCIKMLEFVPSSKLLDLLSATKICLELLKEFEL
jgi:hypothetical protein